MDNVGQGDPKINHDKAPHIQVDSSQGTPHMDHTMLFFLPCAPPFTTIRPIDVCVSAPLYEIIIMVVMFREVIYYYNALLH